MEYGNLVQSLILGLIEGLTEFIPVSSTGHLLIFGHLMNFNSPGHAFEVLIQLGAILAILSVYSAKLTRIAISLPSSPESRKFVLGILVAFLPAAIVGVLAHQFIKQVLFESPTLVCFTLVIGGVVLLVVDRLNFAPRYTNSMEFPIGLCLKIGFCQTLAMIPGVSRSGATIVGALLMGANKRSAAEFSFFLAMPTMVGAFTYDLLKNIDILTIVDFWQISTGFIAAFVSGILVVRWLLDFVEKHGFLLFAWWRILVGTLGLLGIHLIS